MTPREVIHPVRKARPLRPGQVHQRAAAKQTRTRECARSLTLADEKAEQPGEPQTLQKKRRMQPTAEPKGHLAELRTPHGGSQASALNAES